MDGEYTSRILNDAGIACKVTTTIDYLESALEEQMSTLIVAAELLTPDSMRRLKMSVARQRPWSEFALIIMAGADGSQPSGALMREIYESFHHVIFLARPVAINTFVGIVQGTLMEHRRQFDVRALLARNEQELAWRRAVEASLTLANQQLSASEARYRRLLDTANEGILTLTEIGRIDYANRRMTEMLGYCSNELQGKFLQDIVKPPVDASGPMPWLRTNLGHSGQEECEFSRKDGSRLVGIVSHSPIDSTTHENSGFFVMVTDITSRRETEDRFRQLTETIRQVFWLKRPEDGSIIYVSPALDSMWGTHHLDRDSVTPDSLLAGVHPEDQTKVLGFWKEQSKGEELSAEYRIIRCDGTIHWISERSFPVKNAMGHVYRIAGIAEDITATKQIHAELDAARQAAEAASRAKSTFLANLSHEIRTPICAMIGFTELMSDVNLQATERKSYSNIIARNGAQLVALIDDILDLSKIEAGFLQIERDTTPLSNLLTDVKNALALKALNKDITLTLDTCGHIPEMILTDPTRLRQILLNIIGNAIKFTDQGGIKVSVSYRWPCDDKSGELKFTVEDTGCGISDEGKTKLFMPFSQVDTTTTRKFGGTGLGLALSRRLARSLGGDVILASSTPGRGSCFVVTIDAPPVILKPAQVEPPGSLVQWPSAQQNLLPLTGLHVLLAEDTIDSQVLITQFLKIAGAQVDIVRDGAEAVTKAMSDGYDVVLMDVQMPILDGYSATSTLRKRGYLGPIIALTAHAMLGEKEKSLQAGCDYHLVKPVDRRNLINTVAMFCGRKIN